MTELLNAAQHNSLVVTLRALEKDLRQADDWLQGNTQQGALYEQSLALSPDRRVVARALIRSVLDRIVNLVGRFGLAAADEDLGATIAAQMTMDWANLCDLRSDKLRRYGEVDPRLAELLDADVNALAHLTLSLSVLVRENSS